MNKTFLSIVTTQRFRTFSAICNIEKTSLSYRNAIVCEFFFTEFIQPFITANIFLWHILADDKITNTAFITLWKDTYLSLSKYLWKILSIQISFPLGIYFASFFTLFRFLPKRHLIRRGFQHQTILNGTSQGDPTSPS